jgi:hypothetical protein
LGATARRAPFPKSNSAAPPTIGTADANPIYAQGQAARSAAPTLTAQLRLDLRCAPATRLQINADRTHLAVQAGAADQVSSTRPLQSNSRLRRAGFDVSDTATARIMQTAASVSVAGGPTALNAKEAHKALCRAGAEGFGGGQTFRFVDCVVCPAAFRSRAVMSVNEVVHGIASRRLYHLLQT